MAEAQIGDSVAAVNQTNKIDPITLEVVRTGLIAIVHEMTITLARTSYSTIIREVHDYSCVLFDAKGRLIAQAEGIPIFNGSMNFVIDEVLKKYPIEEIEEGDIFISNDPYTGGGTHKNDINIVMPIFWDGKLEMLSASKAHHLDIGGKDPGSWSADAQNTFQEGLSLPIIRLARNGEINEAVTDILFANMRVPQLSRGDFSAQIAAGKTAEMRAHAWLRKNGVQLFRDAAEELIEHGERLTRAAIEAIPDGVYVAEGYADIEANSNEPIPVQVTVTVQGSDIEIDFSGSAKQRTAASSNCHWVNTVSMTREFMMFLTDTSLGANEGSYRPIKIKAEAGSVFKPEYPAPVTTGMGDMGTRLVELLFQALSGVLPDEVIAGTFGNFSCLTIAGFDPDTGAEFVHFSPYAGGWGGRSFADGNTAMVSLGSGDNFNIPCEVMETKMTGLIAESYCLQPKSAGHGKHRGGYGVAYDYRLLWPGEYTVALDRDQYPPYGLFGGGEGSGSGLHVNPNGNSEEICHRKSGVRVPAGTILSHRTAGGGGYGNPAEREPSLVLEDVQDELLSCRDARNIYRVAINEKDLSLDEEGTQRLRAQAAR